MDGVILMKEKLLIVTHHLTIGGVQKSLISALKCFDYDKYDVTLYLRKNRTTLLPYIDKRVNVIVNEDNTHYYRKPYAVILQLKSAVYKVLGKTEKMKACEKELADRMRIDSMEYEKNTYFKDKIFDKAIAYVQGYTVQFVCDYVEAKEKFMFFHTSTDEIHEVHECAFPHIKKIAALHNEQKELIKEWYNLNDEKITIVENYVDKETVIAQSMEYSVDKPEGKTVLCSCGRLSPVKGFDQAIECAKILKNKGVNFFWYFVGDGPEKTKLLSLIEKYELQDYIEITGMKENPYPFMRACDIYVQPSYEEAMPVTIIETIKLQKPVVTTATVGGKKLVSEKTGVVTEISAKALADGIIKLMTDKQLYRDIIEFLEKNDNADEINKFKYQWRELLEE